MKTLRSCHLAIFIIIALFLFPPAVALSLDTDFVWIPYNDPTKGSNLMPNYTWTCGCSPTAMAMVLGYWDNFGPLGSGKWGKFMYWGRIIDYYVDEETVESYLGFDNVNFEWANYYPWDCPARPMLIVDLASEMLTYGEDGGTYAIWEDFGTNRVLWLKGYSDNWAAAHWGDGVWEDIKNSIDDGEPCKVSILYEGGGHSVACFGYSERLNRFATYDTWDEIRHDWSKDVILEHMIRVSPEPLNGEGDISLRAPNGGEEVLSGQILTIEWEQWGTLIDNADLYYSVDGGATFTLIEDQISSGPGVNYYDWAVPEGISTDRARVRIEGWGGVSQILGEDGSKENFDIGSATKITITGPTQVDEESGAQYTCTATRSNGTTVDVTASATWSENSVYAGITSGGYLSTASVTSDRFCMITATFGGKSDTHSVRIKSTLSSVIVNGPTQVHEESGAQYTCTATYSNGSTVDVTASATWSENSVYAGITSGGYLSTASVTSDRFCIITATFDGKSDTHSVILKNNVTISGYVKTSGSTGISGAIVVFTDSGHATTDSSGYYSRTIRYGWSGAATPSLPGYAFSPLSRSYSNITTNRWHQNYTGIALSGSLTVTLLPAAAVSAGAQWNVDAGAWQDSGAVVSGLSVGSHTVNYKAVSGWTAPSSESTPIASDQTTTLTGNYIRSNVSKDELVFNFHGYGLYHYDKTSVWEQWNQVNPSQMVTADLNGDGMDELAAVFPGYSLYTCDPANGWQRINTVDPEKMIAADIDGDGDDELVAGFTGYGLYYYDDLGGWSPPIIDIIPDAMLRYSDEVVCDYGAVYGLWSYNTSDGWVLMNAEDPDKIFVADIDGDGKDELVVSFVGYGLYRYEPESKIWDPINTVIPEQMVAVNLDGDVNEELVISFPGYGLYTYEPEGGIWDPINTEIPEAMIRQGNGIAVDFGATYGLWVWSREGGWQQRNTVDPGQMTAVDIDNDGAEELVVSFPGYGLYSFDETHGWQRLNTVIPDDMKPISFYP